jgi:Asp-tRNA(Asn)/Glu-tRNA(Gln) amidotransferase A subunit family amidase
MMYYHTLEATVCAEAIHDGIFKPRQLAESCLTRISAKEDLVGAWINLDEEYIDAQLSTLEALSKNDRGPLHGLPIGIKDLIDTAGLETAYGSEIYAGHRPPCDAACVTRLRAAGAIIFGKTVTTEFAYWKAGKTRNPHNQTRTPGGSSSGSAAAVADYMVPLAIGSQTSGSVIRPASYCGIIGFKPSQGIICTAGVKALASSLDTIGMFARSVRDIALLASVMAGRPDWAKLTSKNPVAPIIGIARTSDWGAVSAHGIQNVVEAGDLLRDAGANVINLDPPEIFDGLSQAQDTIMVVEAVRDLAFEFKTHRKRLSPVLRDLLARGLSTSENAYNEACSRREQALLKIDELFTVADVLITPSATDEAPKFDDGIGDPIMNRAWTLLGMPSITLPFGNGPLGLPLGVQLLARPGSDAELLRAASWVSKHLMISTKDYL